MANPAKIAQSVERVDDPDAKPAIVLPPRSIAAAVPMMECVELHVSEMTVSKMQASIEARQDWYDRATMQ